MKRFAVVNPTRLFYYSWIVAGHVALIYLLMQQEWMLLAITMFLTYVINIVGISLTFHRALSHRAVKLPKWLEVVGSIIGGFALQGSPLSWAVVHRSHHTYCGTEKDPHSPKYLGSWYIHIFGYVFSEMTPKLSKDLIGSWQGTFHKYYYRIYATILIGSLFVLPLNWALALFWAPVATVFHWENTINTWAHSWDKDEPTNKWGVQFFILGEAYHKNHHDHPGWARFGKYDLVGWFIETFIQKKHVEN